jgi:hypothetical protein
MESNATRQSYRHHHFTAADDVRCFVLDPRPCAQTHIGLWHLDKDRMVGALLQQPVDAGATGLNVKQRHQAELSSSRKRSRSVFLASPVCPARRRPGGRGETPAAGTLTKTQLPRMRSRWPSARAKCSASVYSSPNSLVTCGGLRHVCALSSSAARQLVGISRTCHRGASAPPSSLSMSLTVFSSKSSS